MCPETVIASCDTESSHEIVDNGPQSSLPFQWRRVCLDETVDWNTDDQCDIEPVNMFVEVGSGDGSVGDMNFVALSCCLSLRRRRQRHRSVLRWCRHFVQCR